MEQSGLLNLNNIKSVHFIGIGGISMSGLAEILLNRGCSVSGSDVKHSTIASKLGDKGVKIYIGHNENNIDNPDLVIYTAAVKEDNPELIKSRQLNIPTIERSTLLGEIMKSFPFTLTVSGTHGKTTTTSMLSMILLQAELDPTIHIGGELKAINGSTRIGSNKYFIAEACEYVESFLKFHPYLAIILNIEEDHLDFFKNIDHIKSSFLKYMQLVPQNGYVVANYDDENIVSLLKELNCNIITYGIDSKDAMWVAKDITYNNLGFPSFSVYKNNEKIIQIELKVPGKHNVSNSLAAISASYSLGCNINQIKLGLENYTGTHRRFEVKGVVDDIHVVDDYAHHPSEIKATLEASKNRNHNNIWCVFQPHTYTRTKLLLDEFSYAFKDANTVIISDIYSAREIDTGEINSSMLVQKISALGQKAIYIPEFSSIVEYLNQNVSSGDLIITMGAGDIYNVGEMFLNAKKNTGCKLVV
ncbi:UNVERIFIED_CONTAM: UDP-N-acetylmuramate--L-alanine ligase [Acetivibrio alkalicellulosi]